MKKKMLLVSLILLLAISWAIGCAAPTPTLTPTLTPTPTPTPAVPKPIELSMATYMADTSAVSRTMKFFGDQVTKKTEGRVIFKYYWSGTLGGAEELLPLVASGGVDMAYIAIGYYPASFKLLTLTGLVTLSQHMGSTQKATKQLFEENPAFLKEFDRFNLKPQITYTGGVSPLGSNKKIDSLADMKGMKIRTYGSITPLLQSWGATPVAMPAPETYLAMERGVIDGFAAQPIDAAGTYGLHETTKYLIDVGIGIYYVGFIPINKDTFTALPDDIQKIFEEVSVETDQKFIEIRLNNYREWIPKMLDEGMEIYRLPPELRQELKQIAFPAVKKWWVDQVVEKGVNEAVADQLIAQYKALAEKYDAEGTGMNGFELYEAEFGD